MASRQDKPADPVDVAVGARIRALRKLRGLSQQQFAEATGVTPEQIEKYESGAHRVSATMLTRIARTLDVYVGEIFAGNPTSSERAVDQVADLLAQPGAIELLQAYARLPRGMSRPALVQFVRSFNPPG